MVPSPYSSPGRQVDIETRGTMRRLSRISSRNSRTSIESHDSDLSMDDKATKARQHTNRRARTRLIGGAVGLLACIGFTYWLVAGLSSASPPAAAAAVEHAPKHSSSGSRQDDHHQPAAAAAAAAAVAAADPHEPCTPPDFLTGEMASREYPSYRVLFIGDAFCLYNGLTERYRQLVALEMPHASVEVTVVVRAASPNHLNSHTTPNPRLRCTPAPSNHKRQAASGLEEARFPALPASGGFTHVVLQEASRLPGLLALREYIEHAPKPEHQLAAEANASAAAMRALVASATASGASEFVLFQTWGWRDGDSDTLNTFGSYANMQSRLVQGYSILAAEARGAVAEVMELSEMRESLPPRVRVAPVGAAFSALHESDPHATGVFGHLYNENGVHPSPLGTDLAVGVLAYSLHGFAPRLAPTSFGSVGRHAGVPESPLASALRSAALKAVSGCDATREVGADYLYTSRHKPQEQGGEADALAPGGAVAEGIM